MVPTTTKKENHAFLDGYFNSLIVGLPGTGKTTLLTNLITHPKLYNNDFKFTLFCSPYPIPSFEKQMVKGVNWKKAIDIEWLYERIQAISSRQDTKDHVHLLIVFDDVCAQQRKMQNDNEFKALFFNRRHLIKNGSISCFTTTQRYMEVPPCVRGSLTSLFSYQQNPKDLELIQKEQFYSDKEIELKKIAKIVWKQKHNFLYIQMSSRKVYSNFNQVIKDE